jgi:hypothetical protein
MKYITAAAVILSEYSKDREMSEEYIQKHVLLVTGR